MNKIRSDIYFWAFGASSGALLLPLAGFIFFVTTPAPLLGSFGFLYGTVLIAFAHMVSRRHRVSLLARFAGSTGAAVLSIVVARAADITLHDPYFAWILRVRGVEAILMELQAPLLAGLMMVYLIGQVAMGVIMSFSGARITRRFRRLGYLCICTGICAPVMLLSGRYATLQILLLTVMIVAEGLCMSALLLSTVRQQLRVPTEECR
jgi:hypothetical protein